MREYDLNAGEIPNLDQVPQKLMRKSMRKIARAVSDRIKVEIPVRSGRLASTVRSRVPADGRSGQILVGNKRAWYAHLIEGGTKSHVIPRFSVGRRTKRRAQSGYLTKLSGRVVWVNQFSHPGSPPKPFMERGVSKSLPDVEKILVDLGNQELATV